MVRQLIAALTLFLSFPCFAEDKLLVLTETTIGDMPIFPGMEISLYKIRQHFPFYRVVHEIGEGDSPDFHEYTVMTHEGDELLSFISYIDDQQGYERSIVPLDEIITSSAKVADAYGVSPGTLVRDALVSREELEFG